MKIHLTIEFETNGVTAKNVKVTGSDKALAARIESNLPEMRHHKQLL